jgi:hypothetical protein
MILIEVGSLVSYLSWNLGAFFFLYYANKRAGVYPPEGVFSLFTAKLRNISIFCFFESMGVSLGKRVYILKVSAKY